MSTTVNLDSILNDPTVSDDDLLDFLTQIVNEATAAVAQISAPMTHDQRRAMFASFTNVFGAETKTARRIFTRLVLGKPADAPVSWADYANGSLTKREASKVLTALTDLEKSLGLK